MELVKNIFFNTDKLIQDSTVKISYTGEFFQNNSENVFIHFGFDNDWNGLTEIPMKKTELGFQAEIKLSSDAESLNLVFKDSNDNWDNNNGQNYSFSVESAPVALAVVEDAEITYPRRLRKTYLWSKKIRLAVYKIIRYFPRIISGNYKKKETDA